MTLLRFQNRSLIVADAILEETLSLAQRAARSNATVLICGESGTGKELIARYIHEQSSRAKGPFVSVNCAAIPEGLMEAELFGFERGAFTGAFAQRIGRFERANGGSLLLDEISELPLPLQAKLLRVLQEGEIDRLGGKESVPIQARILATCNRDPLELVKESVFRHDLYYRLNVLRIECRPLRDRPQAVRALAEEFLRQTGERLRPGERFSLSAASLRLLQDYSWPGNIRELSNAVERAVLLADGLEIEPSHFTSLSEPASRKDSPEPTTLAEVEQSHILQILESSGGNRAAAARKLEISVRTLRNKLKEYGG